MATEEEHGEVLEACLEEAIKMIQTQEATVRTILNKTNEEEVSSSLQVKGIP